MTRKEIEAEYRVDENGVIRSPGKFESAPVFAPYFYDFMLDGGEDDMRDDNTAVFNVQSEDLIEFPELEGTARIILHQNDDGFISCWQEN